MILIRSKSAKIQCMQIANLSSMLSTDISRLDKMKVKRPMGSAKVCAVGEKVCFEMFNNIFYYDDTWSVWYGPYDINMYRLENPNEMGRDKNESRFFSSWFQENCLNFHHINCCELDYYAV